MLEIRSNVIRGFGIWLTVALAPHSSHADCWDSTLPTLNDVVFQAVPACKRTPASLEEVTSNLREIRETLAEMNLYPVFQQDGELLGMASVEGPVSKKTALVLRPGKKFDPDRTYHNLVDFDQYQLNHYRRDLPCVVTLVSKEHIRFPSEKKVLSCIDRRIETALKSYHLPKARRFSLKKLFMVFKYSRGENGLFDSFTQCADPSDKAQFVFFQGKGYNRFDFGNFVWGAILERLKVSDFNKKVGSTLNGYISGGRQNGGFLRGFHPLGDHPLDQVAIFDGARWVRELERRERAEKRAQEE